MKKFDKGTIPTAVLFFVFAACLFGLTYLSSHPVFEICGGTGFALVGILCLMAGKKKKQKSE